MEIKRLQQLAGMVTEMRRADQRLLARNPVIPSKEEHAAKIAQLLMDAERLQREIGELAGDIENRPDLEAAIDNVVGILKKVYMRNAARRSRA